MIKTRRLLAIAVAVALVFPVVAAGASPASHGHAKHRISRATFGAAPATSKGPTGQSIFQFDTSPGGRQVTYIEVSNFARKPVTLAIYPVDAVPATNGVISFPAPNAPRREAGAWLSVGTPGGKGLIHMKPRAQVLLPVHVRVPMNAPPGDHIGAIIVSLTGKATGQFGGNPTKLNFDQRIAVQAAFRVSGPTHPNLTVEDLGASYSGPIDPFAKGKVTVTYKVHNGGNIVLGGPQSVSVHGLFGEHVAGPKQVSIPALLPGATFPVKVVVHKVFPEVLMSASVRINETGLQGDYNTGLHPVSASVHFLAIPWVILVCLLLLILGLCFAYGRRRRRRSEAGKSNPNPSAERTAT